jgi:hypothetical protein
MTTHTDTETYQVFWGNMDLGHTDTQAHAEGVIRQHINRRQHGQRDSRATMRKEYRIETWQR